MKKSEIPVTSKDNDIPEIKFYIRLVGENLDPKEITDELKIQPSVYWKKGEKRKYGGEYPFGSWCFGTEYEESYDLDDQIRKVYNVLKTKKFLLKKLIIKFKIEAIFQSVINMYGNQTAAIYLKKYIVDFASFVGIGFDFDTFIISKKVNKNK